MRSRIPISRRAFLATVGIAGGAAAAAVVGSGIPEIHELSIERIEINLPRLPRRLDGFRLVQISDIHFNDFTHAQHLRLAVDAANAERPDLTVITGDFVSAPILPFRPSDGTKAAENAWPCAQVLQTLRATHGRFAVLGNHDLHTQPAIVAEALNASGTTVLRNSSVPIEAGGARFWLAGTDDFLDGNPDLDRSLQPVSRGECVVMAVHEPDAADRVRRYPVDLQISGHSHGGQVRLPAVGPLCLPTMGKKYPMGYYRVGNLQLYTNRGLGVIDLPIRFRCPPELAVITLKSADASVNG